LIIRILNKRAMRDHTEQVICREYEDYVLTHELVPFGPIPTVFDPNGVYPYVSYCETSKRPVLKKYRFVLLENDQIKVSICPDLGGKVTSIIHIKSGKEVLYAPQVIRHTRILPRFYFVPGGIEVSFPISHSPVQNEKVLYKIQKTRDRTYVACGERELRFGMQWSVEYSLGPLDNFLTQRTVFHNPGSSAYPWMSWSNAALPSAEDTEYHFPKGKVLSHSSKMETIDWEKDGPKTEADIKEMTGYFWQSSDVNAFGAYTPSLKSGLYHISDEGIAPGIKLWSYGRGADMEWAMLSTAKRQPYLEIQGGPIRDQSIKLELKPKETRWHTEHWFPTDEPLDIYSLRIPFVKLRPIGEVPRFEWARTDEVKVWQELEKVCDEDAEFPEPPGVQQNLWPPSGMENLHAAFEKAIDVSVTDVKDIWRFYYGTWLAGRGDTENAIRALSPSGSGLSKVVLARLLKSKGDINAAIHVINTVKEPWLQLHPQVIVERDKLLRNLGDKTIPEREQWLTQVNALDEEWLAERKIQLMIDKGEFQQAKNLLLSTPFQKVHQTYERTDLWIQICNKLDEPWFPVPRELGEDNLYAFGAYREFE
jgi:hypothetical protein